MLTIVTGGAVNYYFAGSSPIEATYSLYSTDFNIMFQAIGAIPQIYAAEFLKEAIRAELFVTNAKERLF